MEIEESRTHHYLSSQTASPLRRILENNLLTPHLSTLISLPNSGLDVMIDSDQIEDLGRLYRLFTMVPYGLPCLKKSIKESIARRGQEINRASSGSEDGELDVEGVGNDQATSVSTTKGKGKGRSQNVATQTLSLALKWVQDVLDLKDKFDQVWRRALQSDRELESTLNEVRSTLIRELITLTSTHFRPSSPLSISTKNHRNSSRCPSMIISRRVLKG